MSTNYIDQISSTISSLRKQQNMTQDSLADKLGVTFQAISKWENGISCPDIGLLPEIASIFNVSVDYLFGIKGEGYSQTAPVNTITTNTKLPWEDDNTLRAVLYKGRTLIDCDTYPMDYENFEFTFVYDGEALNVESYLSLKCNDVEGNATAGHGLECKDVNGNVTSGHGVNCKDIGGNVYAGHGVNCQDVGGAVQAGHNVTCGEVGGGVNAGHSVHCGDVGGSVNGAQGVHISCND